MNEKDAVEIATRFLKDKSAQVRGFAKADYLAEENTWACIFEKVTPPGAVDAPGALMVLVNCQTGEPSFFDTM